MGLGEIRPGKGKGPGLHQAFNEEELRRIMRRASRRLEARHGVDACEALDQKNYRTAHGRAHAQLAALLLNRAAGFLDGWRGLVLATVGAFYVFLKYAKLMARTPTSSDG